MVPMSPGRVLVEAIYGFYAVRCVPVIARPPDDAFPSLHAPRPPRVAFPIVGRPHAYHSPTARPTAASMMRRRGAR